MEKIEQDSTDNDETTEVDSKKAGKLRKKLHISAAEGNLTDVRRILRDLYDSAESPVNDAPNTPEKFTPLLESTILSLLSQNEILGAEMLKNIDHLYQAYGVSKKHKNKCIEIIEKCISEFNTSDTSFSEFSCSLEKNLNENTCFKSVKIGRYGDKFSIKKVEN